MQLVNIPHPLAITMWDFSWLERRWPGAGYEDWDLILDELQERGYDAVRIDPYPHLLAVDQEKEWELLPVWTQQAWGSPALNRVIIQPALNQFLAKCKARAIKVALSSWFRQDRDNLRMLLKTPQDLGRVWRHTLDSIADAGLLDTLLYVDLCNEFPRPWCAPFFAPQVDTKEGGARNTPDGRRWMHDAIAVVRTAYPELEYSFSFISEIESQQDVSFLDFLELHLFMTMWSDFDEQVGYTYEFDDSQGYAHLVQKGEVLYRSDPQKWKNALSYGIELAAEWSRSAHKPLITTEGWGVINYKDWPLLDWEWVKELCEYGVRQASATGRWVAMATSSFCGPQFVGMWRDVNWHRRLTDRIHHGPLNAGA
jgi:sugar-binding cellulase-like protein